MCTALAFAFLGSVLGAQSIGQVSGVDAGLGELPSESSGGFAFEEILVTPKPVFDFEFDQASNRFTWVVIDTGDVWVADVDPVTGAFIPDDGKGTPIDVDAVLPGNSSEWATTPPNNRIVYTKRPPGQMVRMAQAEIDGAGVWHPSELELSEHRVNPAGNPLLVGGQSLILYIYLSIPGPFGMDAVDPGPAFDLIQERVAWRVLDDPSTERVVPKSLGATGARWVPGEPGLVFTKKVDDLRQVFYYDAAAHSTTQLTFDGGTKQTVFMWEAPEFPGEKIFFASVKLSTQSQIRVYRYLDPEGDGSFAWTVIKTLNGGAGKYFWSPEPFIHNGRSYVFWVTSSKPDQPSFLYPSQIWVAAVDPADSYYKNISPPQTSRFRLDPEVYVTEQGPSIYYNRYTYDPHGYEGVYRVDLGLGPAVE